MLQGANNFDLNCTKSIFFLIHFNNYLEFLYLQFKEKQDSNRCSHIDIHLYFWREDPEMIGCTQHVVWMSTVFFRRWSTQFSTCEMKENLEISPSKSISALLSEEPLVPNKNIEVFSVVVLNRCGSQWLQRGKFQRWRAQGQEVHNLLADLYHREPAAEASTWTWGQR